MTEDEGGYPVPPEVAEELRRMNRSAKVAEIIIKLKRLAEDQRGKPEGIAALNKINELIAKYPDVRPAIVPVWDFTTRDFAFLRRHGVNTDGSWTGINFDDAIRKMQEDYCRRYMDYMDKNSDKTYGELILEHFAAQLELAEGL